MITLAIALFLITNSPIAIICLALDLLILSISGSPMFLILPIYVIQIILILLIIKVYEMPFIDGTGNR